MRQRSGIARQDGYNLVQCSRITALQLGEFVGNGVDRSVDLCLAVVGRDEESQAGCVFGDDRVQNWLYVNASLEQSF